MRPLLLCISFLLLFSATSKADNAISGSWVGNYRFNLLSSNPRKLVVELQLYNDSLLTGASHLYYRFGKYEHYTLSGVFHAADSTVELVEDSTISLRLSLFESNCLGRYKMKMYRTDSSLRLDGRWKDKSGDLFGCPATGAWLEKPIPKKPVSMRPKGLDRPQNIQSLIEIPKEDADSIHIEVSDNAEIDGDVVSVYTNDSLLAPKLLLAGTPTAFVLALDAEHPIRKVQLVAESNGRIPPCTAKVTVTTRKGRWSTILSSSEAGTAVIELFRKD
jgi:hypothetical protein